MANAVRPCGVPQRFFGDFLIAEKVTRRRSGETLKLPGSDSFRSEVSKASPRGETKFRTRFFCAAFLASLRNVD